MANRLDSGGTALGRGFADEIIRIAPTRIVAFGIDAGDRENWRVPGRDVTPQRASR